MWESDEVTADDDQEQSTQNLVNKLRERLHQLVEAVLRERNAFTMESALDRLSKLEKDDGVTTQQALTRAQEQIEFGTEAVLAAIKSSEHRFHPGVSQLSDTVVVMGACSD